MCEFSVKYKQLTIINGLPFIQPVWCTLFMYLHESTDSFLSTSCLHLLTDIGTNMRNLLKVVTMQRNVRHYTELTLVASPVISAKDLANQTSRKTCCVVTLSFITSCFHGTFLFRFIKLSFIFS